MNALDGKVIHDNDGHLKMKDKVSRGSAICTNSLCPGPGVIIRDGNSASIMGSIYVTESIGFPLKEYQSSRSFPNYSDSIISSLKQILGSP